MNERGLLSYTPHSGHADQMRQLTLARALAEVLQRTLVLPSLLSHFDATASTPTRFIRKRPSVGWLLNITTLDVPLVEASSLTWTPRSLPRCLLNKKRGGGSEDHTFPSCVHHLEPPPANSSVSAYLTHLAGLSQLPWIHFRSMLWVHSERLAQRSPLAVWEEQLVPTSSCLLRFRGDVVAAARAALETILPATTRYVAVHVRTLREAEEKGEREDEWKKRLVRFVQRLNTSSAGKPQVGALYLATDDTSAVVGKATTLLSSHGITVYSGSSVSTPALLRIHADDATAARLALDMIALVNAETFSGSPRSGLSVHLLSLRACERLHAQCAPHACVPFASTACGGRFPAMLLRRGARDLPRHGPKSERCTAMDAELSAQGLTRATAPRTARPQGPKVLRCATAVRRSPG